MTCVVALVQEDGTIWMGADSAATSGNSSLDLLGFENNSKIIRKKAGTEKCLIGAAGNALLIQILEHHVTLPALPNSTKKGAIMHWLVVDVVKVIRSAFKEQAIIATKEGVESVPGELLIGVHDRLYEVGIGNFFVRAIIDDTFAAIGSGAAEACGACFAIRKLKVKSSPRTIILTALEAAERWTPNVRRPFQIIHIHS